MRRRGTRFWRRGTTLHALRRNVTSWDGGGGKPSGALRAVMVTSFTARSRPARNTIQPEAAPMTARTALSERIRHEFVDLPGLKLTMAQACRLWSADETVCRDALATLIDEGFLRRTPSGAFIALPRPRGASAKAMLPEPRRTRCPHCHHLNVQSSTTARCAACTRLIA
jgi:hypothetical protein